MHLRGRHREKLGEASRKEKRATGLDACGASGVAASCRLRWGKSRLSSSYCTKEKQQPPFSPETLDTFPTPTYFSLKEIKNVETGPQLSQRCSRRKDAPSSLCAEKKKETRLREKRKAREIYGHSLTLPRAQRREILADCVRRRERTPDRKRTGGRCEKRRSDERTSGSVGGWKKDTANPLAVKKEKLKPPHPQHRKREKDLLWWKPTDDRSV